MVEIRYQGFFTRCFLYEILYCMGIHLYGRLYLHRNKHVDIKFSGYDAFME